MCIPKAAAAQEFDVSWLEDLTPEERGTGDDARLRILEELACMQFWLCSVGSALGRHPPPHPHADGCVDRIAQELRERRTWSLRFKREAAAQMAGNFWEE